MTHFLEADNVMIDLETLATRADAAMMSIGACRFKFNEGLKTLEEFYINVDAKDCARYGAFIDPDTIEWWKGQDKAAIKALQTPTPVSMKDALDALTKWFGENTKKPYVWSCGAAFDIPILELSYKKLGMEPPWKYNQVMCYRTVLNVAGISNKKLREGREDQHHALGDAKAQAIILMNSLNEVPF